MDIVGQKIKNRKKIKYQSKDKIHKDEVLF